MKTVFRSVVAVGCLAGASVARSAEPATVVTYDQVRPVFRKRCVGCHNSERPRGSLDLTTINGIKAGSVSGAVVVNGAPDESLLYTLPAHLEEPYMPPDSPQIPGRELDLIRDWITGGMQSSTPGKPAIASTEALVVPVTAVVRHAPLTALAVNHTGDVIAVSGDRQVALYSLADNKWLHAFPFPEGEVHILEFSVDGSLLLAGGGQPGVSGHVVGFDVASGRRMFELGDETDIVLTADLSPDRQTVALGGPSRTVKLFQVSDGACLATLRKHTDWILTLAFSPDGLLLASGDRFGGLQLWDVATGDEFANLRGHVGAVTGLAFTADSEHLVSVGADGTSRWWDLNKLTESGRSVVQPGGATVVQISGDRVLTGGRKGKLILTAPDFTSQWELQRPDELVELAVTRDGRQAVAADAAGGISVFDVDSGRELGQLELPLNTAAAAELSAIVPKPRRIPTVSAAPVTDPDVTIATDEHAATLQDLAEAEAAVRTAEEALQRARERVAQLKALAERQAGANQSPRPNSP